MVGACIWTCYVLFIGMGMCVGVSCRVWVCVSGSQPRQVTAGPYRATTPEALTLRQLLGGVPTSMLLPAETCQPCTGCLAHCFQSSWWGFCVGVALQLCEWLELQSSCFGHLVQHVCKCQSNHHHTVVHLPDMTPERIYLACVVLEQPTGAFCYFITSATRTC